MPSDDQRDYAVGYAKPPRNTRFKRGQSGNPKGRPSGKRALSSVLSDALTEFVTVVDNGQRRRITKLEAIGTQLVNRSASGDPKATQRLLPLLRDTELRGDPGSNDPAAFTESDEQIIQQILARLRGEKE